MDLELKFWGQINKGGGGPNWGFADYAYYFDAGFVKPTLNNIFSYILLNVFN